MVLGLLATAVITIVMLDGVPLRSRVRVEVMFENIGSLSVGSEVVVAGQTIGKVESVRLVPARAAKADDHLLHPTGGVAVKLAIENKYVDRTPINGEYFINFRGIFGASYLEIGPPADGSQRQRPLQTGDTLRGVDPPLLDRVLVRSFQNLTSSRLFLAAIKPEAKRVAAAVTELSETLDMIEPGAEAYEQVGESLSAMTGEARQLSDTLEKSLDLDRVIDIAHRADQTLARLDTELGSLGKGIDKLRADIASLGDKVPPDLRARFVLAATRARTSLDRLRAITRDARAIMAAVDRGEGTVGALLNDPEFIDDAKKLGKTLKRQPWRLLGHPGDR